MEWSTGIAYIKTTVISTGIYLFEMSQILQNTYNTVIDTNESYD